MAVEVKLSNRDTETTAEATSIRVDEQGHLILQKSTSATTHKVIAVYAPSVWRSAALNDVQS